MAIFETFLNTMLGSLPTMTITVLATLAITLIFKTSYTTNFAQGVIAAFGAYVAMQLFYSFGIPVYIGIIFAVISGVAIGLFIDIVIIRNGRNVNAVGKQIITMGIVTILVALIPVMFGVAKLEAVSLIPFTALDQHVTLFGNVSMQLNTIICVIITVIIVVAVFLMLNYSKWGLGVRSTASNEIVAGMVGINTKVITAMSWAVAGGIGAVAATMYAGMAQLSGALFMTTIQVNAFLAGILGGFSTFYGPVFGAIIITVISALVGFITIYIPELSLWKEVIVYVILLLLVLWKPQGLFGQRSVKKV